MLSGHQFDLFVIPQVLYTLVFPDIWGLVLKQPGFNSVVNTCKSISLGLPWLSKPQPKIKPSSLPCPRKLLLDIPIYNIHISHLPATQIEISNHF